MFSWHRFSFCLYTELKAILSDYPSFGISNLPLIKRINLSLFKYMLKTSFKFPLYFTFKIFINGIEWDLTKHSQHNHSCIHMQNAECLGIYTISSLTHSLYLVLQKPSLLIYAKRKTISHICTKPYFLLENQRNVVYSFTFCYRARLRVDGSRYITSFIYVLFILFSTTKTTCKQICQDFSYETCMFYCKSFWHADKSFFFCFISSWSLVVSSYVTQKVLWLYVPPYQYQMDDAGSKVVVWIYIMNKYSWWERCLTAATLEIIGLSLLRRFDFVAVA